jgi:hypothetical protein
VRDLARNANLIAKPRQCAFVAGDRLREELESDWLFECQVVRAIDFAHAAFAEHRYDAVSFGEQRSR